MAPSSENNLQLDSDQGVIQTTPAKKRRKATPPSGGEANLPSPISTTPLLSGQAAPGSGAGQQGYSVVNWGWSPQRGKFKPKSVVSVIESNSPSPNQAEKTEGLAQASSKPRKASSGATGGLVGTVKRKLTMVKSDNPESYSAKSKWQLPVSPFIQLFRVVNHLS